MATVRTPLLADTRRSSEHSDRRAEEEDAALHGEPTSGTRNPWNGARIREIVLFSWALLATAALIVLAVFLQHNNSVHEDDSLRPPAFLNKTSPEHKTPIPHHGGPNAKRNLVFMVSDGMGPASLSLTRSFRQLVDGLPIDDTLTLDRHFWGTSRTRSSSSLVTDSAAGATAFSCGHKSYNGAIAVTPDFAPCGTVLEAAKRAGYATGLVVTTDVTDATPACFAAHVPLRQMMDQIAVQQVGEGVLGRVVDLILGGGRCHFLPNGTAGSCREDDVDVAKIARETHGWNYADNRAGFDAMQMGRNVSLPTLGLFAGYDIPFEIDRMHMADVYPSLSEMAVTALKALEEATKDSEQGFFLMIEGSRIDHAGHINDPAAQVREVLEYDKAFKAVMDFIKASDTETVLVATSDHETGGLATAWQSPSELPVYKWYPQVLAAASASSENLARLLRQHVASHPDEPEDELKDWIRHDLVKPYLGIAHPLDVEISALASNPTAATTLFAHMVSLRARVGWSTHGHSAVDVNIYSSGGPGTERLRGNVENTEIGRFLGEYLGVDVDAITRELRSKMEIHVGEDVLRAAAGDAGEAWDDGHPVEWMVDPVVFPGLSGM